MPALLWSRTAVPLACAAASAGVMPTPVPLAPAVPTEVIVTVCVADRVSVSPTARLLTDATLRLVAPAAAAADSVVAVPAVPIALTVTSSLSITACWPATKPVTLPTLSVGVARRGGGEDRRGGARGGADGGDLARLAVDGQRVAIRPPRPTAIRRDRDRHHRAALDHRLRQQLAAAI